MRVPKLRSSIVLVHGLLGYDRVRIGSWTLADYFPGIPAMLAQAGNRVLVARVNPVGGVAERAAQLKALLDRHVPSEPVHLIAHSMGGLDARYLISCLGMAARVLSLTTIGTPHRGSPFADWGVGRFDRILRPFFFELLGIPETRAFYDLTTAKCRLFNERVPDAPSVRYFSVAGHYDGRLFGPQWQLYHGIVERAEGPNDGVVSVASATYGESMETWQADHLGLVNWPHNWLRTLVPPGDRLEDYARLVGRLADEGF
jgi:triacylglycerol lipase